MRHSRKAVMKEHYKLYLKKNIFNGRYFVRNVQIGLCLILVMALVIGVIVAVHMPKDKTVQTSAEISVKDALFGNSEEENVITKAEDLALTEEMNPAESESDSLSDEEISSVDNAKGEAVITESTDGGMDEATEDLADGAGDVNEKLAGSEMAAYYDESEKVAQAQALRDQQSKFSDRCIANVEETLNIRQEPDAESEFVGAMNSGAIARVLGTEGDWTKIKSGDVEGYVLSDYVLTGEAAEKFSQDYVTLRGSALEDGVNIREEATTNSDILQVLNKDDTISVIEMPETLEDTQKEEEKAEEEVTGTLAQDEQKVTDEDNSETAEISWIHVMLEDGRTGFVSTDLIRVDELYELAVSAEELQRIAEEEAAKKAAEEEAERRALAQANAPVAGSDRSDSSDNSSTNTTSTASNETYQGATTTPVTATASGDCIGTFTITAYCGCSKCSGGHSKTASGTTPTEGRTIAADTSILPYGTQVVIDGIVYTVEDCGSGVSGNHIDIFFATHDKAMAYGRKSVKVYKY